MRNQIVTINGKSGEYTGYSFVDGKIIHSFSMYNGSIIRRGSLAGISAIAVPAPAELGGLFNYGCTRP